MAILTFVRSYQRCLEVYGADQAVPDGAVQIGVPFRVVPTGVLAGHCNIQRPGVV
jgi:hypothetical protein